MSQRRFTRFKVARRLRGPRRVTMREIRSDLPFDGASNIAAGSIAIQLHANTTLDLREAIGHRQLRAIKHAAGAAASNHVARSHEFIRDRE